MIILAILAVALATYTERLTLRPLSVASVLQSFTFEQRMHSNTSDYYGFPRALGSILEKTNTQQLHVRFGAGWWDADQWGAEPQSDTPAAAIGAEVWAYIEAPTEKEARQRWGALMHSLSGLFCASFNFIDEKSTSAPSSQIYGVTGEPTGTLYILRGALSGEPVCTENLTPFVKLLPCKGAAGLGALLSGHRLFDSQWHSIAIDVDVEGGERRLRQRVDAVANVQRTLDKERSELPIPIPYDDLECEPRDWEAACFPKEVTSANFSLSQLLGVLGNCGGTELLIEAPGWTISGAEIENGVPYTVTEPIDVVLSGTQPNPLPPPPILVDRSQTVRGQQSGGLRTVFTNPSGETVVVRYFESLPWFVRVYMHTLQVLPGTAQKDLYFSSAVTREKPSQLEMEISVGPHAQVVLEYQVEVSLLYIEEYPPDANHGFEISAGVAVANNKTIHTTSLLLSVPVPDFSMPYNVIILTCTMMAFSFSTILNLLSKRVVPEEIGERALEEKFLQRLRRVLT